MMHLTKATITAVVCVMLAERTFAEVRVAQNSRGQTTEISGLFRDPSCSPVDVSGRVVKREFANDSVTMNGFVVEHPDGTRTFINVGIPSDLDMATRSAIYDGLQRLLLQGRTIHGKAFACGAAGRVLTLENLK